MSEKSHTWELPTEEKKKLLPNVKPEFYSSPHAWEVDETQELKSTHSNTRKVPSERIKPSFTKDKKRLERASSSNTNIFEQPIKPAQKRLDLKKNTGTQQKHVIKLYEKKSPNKESSLSIFDRLSAEPKQQIKVRERTVHLATSPPGEKLALSSSPAKSKINLFNSQQKRNPVESNPAPTGMDPGILQPKQRVIKPLKLKIEKSKPKNPSPVEPAPNSIQYVSIDQFQQELGDWADDTSPMDYSKVPIWK
jgi:hypothetical protein